MYYKCLEAVFTKILVIDERIQSSLDDTYKSESAGDFVGKEIEFRLIYSKTGIIVPETTADINLNKNDLKSKEQLSELMNYIKINISNCNFLILHFGILEVLNTYFKNALEDIKGYNKKCKIVLISGRGKTQDIPSDEYFINQSSFGYYLTSSFGRSKLHLTQLLMATR